MATQRSQTTLAGALAGAPCLGFGCGDLYGGEALAASVRLVEAALDAGIRYFDAARLYGNGSAEAVLGAVLPGMRSEVVIASKAGILPWSMLHWERLARRAALLAHSAMPPLKSLLAPPRPAGARHGAFRLRDLERSLERSLKALRTDYLDILLLHECTVADAGRPEIHGYLQDLRAKGRIRAFGIATHFAETVAILKASPQMGRVVQIASDAINGNVGRLPSANVELVVAHSPIKHALAPLMKHLAADPAAAARWERGTGLAADDRAGAARLLLAEAAAQNPGGVVVFSSSRPEHIRGAVASVGRNGAPLAAAREELALARGRLLAQAT